MNRRGFLSRTFGSILAGCVAPFLPKLSKADRAIQLLKFHPDAFALSMQPLNVTRMDCLYGFGTLRPDFAVREWDDPPRGSFLDYLDREKAI